MLVTFCCVNFVAGEVLGIFMFAYLGVSYLPQLPQQDLWHTFETPPAIKKKPAHPFTWDDHMHPPHQDQYQSQHTVATKQQPHHEDQPHTQDAEQDQVPRYKTVTTQS